MENAIRYSTIASQPIETLPNTTDYEWAGTTLQRALGSPSPIAEIWPFFSGPTKPAVIKQAALPQGDPITMYDLVTHAPEILGPEGADPENQGQKYFFVKFLDPSDFPPFAYVGFNPATVIPLRRRLERQRGRAFEDEEAFAQAFRAYLADLFWQDRRAVQQFAELIRPRMTAEAQFHKLKQAYKAWAITQAVADWDGPILPAQRERFAAFAEPPAQLLALLTEMQGIRRRITSLMHRISFEDDQAILIETPTLHAIAGLSLQVHPKTPENFHPKDELWIYQPLYTDGQERAGWILVEPQRTFDKTESGGDFFTPFAWTGGRLGFRKPMTAEYLQRFVSLIDVRAYPRQHYLRHAALLTGGPGTLTGQARWHRLVDDPSWPYFTACELRFTGPGEAVTPLTHRSFSELHATRGAIEVILRAAHGATSTATVSPSRPLLLPASLPYDTITYRATTPARLLLFTR